MQLNPVPRATLIADNSDVLNWGCRSTSFALRQILSRNLDIGESIKRKDLSAPLAWSGMVPDRAYGRIVRKLTVNGSTLLSQCIAALGTYSPWTHDLSYNAVLLKRARSKSAWANRMMAALESSEIVVINGEGEMIFRNPARQSLLSTLTLIHVAKTLGKPIFYVNAMISDCPQTGRNSQTAEAAIDVLKGCKLSLRDPVSFQIAKELFVESEAAYVPDALFAWRLPSRSPCTEGSTYELIRPLLERSGQSPLEIIKRPFVVVSGSSSASKNTRLAIAGYKALVERLKSRGHDVLLVATCAGDAFLSDVAQQTETPFLPVRTPISAGSVILGRAQAMISGRWHPSIMASLGGTPVVMLGSNSHKTTTLLHMLPYHDPQAFPDIPDEQSIDLICNRVERELGGGNLRRTEISGAAIALGERTRELATLIR